MSQWKISVAITTYKREWKSIIRSIESVLNQTYPIYELLLVDDNDATSEYSREIRQEVLKLAKVRYVPMGKNGGVCKARNHAIEEARGDLLAFLDDDDEWHPEKLATQVRLFDETPNLGIAFVTGRILFEGSDKEEYTWQHQIFKPEPTLEDMLWTDYVGSASVPLISMKALREVGGFLTENQPAEEDYELWIRIARKYAVRGTNDVYFIKHMDNSAHISTRLDRVYEGFRNIYRINKADYRKYPRAHVAILWNICRCGVRAKLPQVTPYVIKLFFYKIYAKLRGC
ncbi:MAG: glycosyltransferase family 2 protein [Clostridia bacterium]|nr:glycosyltransferase family 2 protein [Clostridia bacterium]